MQPEIDFDFEGAKKAGYSDEEIKDYVSKEQSKIEKSKPYDYEIADKNAGAFEKISTNARNFAGDLGKKASNLASDTGDYIKKKANQALNLIGIGEEEPEEPIQINEKLAKKFNYDLKGALESGYQPEEINNYLENENQKEYDKMPLWKKAGRLTAQFGLGALEGSQAGIAYDISTIPFRSENAMNSLYRDELMNDIERLDIQKSSGQWDEQDEKIYENLQKQLLDPNESKKFIKTDDISIRGLAEKVTGADLEAEGILEKAAHWRGMLSSPKSAKELIQFGTSPKQIIKAINPFNSHTAAALGAGTALEMAEQGQLGPMGTLAAAITGDVLARGLAGTVKIAMHPVKSIKKGANYLGNTKAAIRESLNEAKQGTVFTKDLGSITQNEMVQMIQSRLAASGLTGKPLQELRSQMTREIVQEYESISGELGAARFQSAHEAGEITQRLIQETKEKDAELVRNFYKKAEESLESNAKVHSRGVSKIINDIRKKLKPGSVKSEEQKKVLQILSDLENDIYRTIENKQGISIPDKEGNLFVPKESKQLKDIGVREAMNNKVALNDIIKYEVPGGQKKMLISLVNELDQAILSHGKKNPSFALNYKRANLKFAQHAKTFRNREINNLLKTTDPEKILRKMDSVQGIREVKRILYKSPEGKELFQELSRKKLDDMIGNNLQNNLTEQLTAGKFFNILENPKNKSILKEILSDEGIKALEHLQKHVGEIQKNAMKFFNASQSATAGFDLIATAGILKGIAGLAMGNPWGTVPLISFLGARGLSKLISDPEFLRNINNAVKAGSKNNLKLMNEVSKEMINYLNEISPGLIDQLIKHEDIQEMLPQDQIK